jgi:hypothetical protein
MNPRGLRSLPLLAELLALLVAGLLLAGCPSNEPELAQPPQSEAPETPGEAPSGELLASVHMGDPAAAAQLLEGFYGIEQGVWRWTAKKFVVALDAPAAPGQDLQLEFKFTLPEAVAGRLQNVTLSARVNGADLGSETYDQAGDHLFAKPVPAAAVQDGEALKVEFELDKALPPSEADKRELGIVALSVALK